MASLILFPRYCDFCRQYYLLGSSGTHQHTAIGAAAQLSNRSAQNSGLPKRVVPAQQRLVPIHECRERQWSLDKIVSQPGITPEFMFSTGLTLDDIYGLINSTHDKASIATLLATAGVTYRHILANAPVKSAWTWSGPSKVPMRATELKFSQSDWTIFGVKHPSDLNISLEEWGQIKPQW